MPKVKLQFAETSADMSYRYYCPCCGFHMVLDRRFFQQYRTNEIGCPYCQLVHPSPVTVMVPELDERGNVK